MGLEFALSSLALQPGHKQLLAQMLRADPRERIGDIAQLRAAYAQCSTPQFGQPTPNSATGPSQQFPRQPHAGRDENALMPSTWLSRELVPRVDKLAKEGSSTGKIAAWTGLTLLTWFAFVFQVVLIPLGFLLSRELQNDNRPELEREKHRWLHEAKSAHETLARAARSLESALR